jgi:hypothetical protein
MYALSYTHRHRLSRPSSYQDEDLKIMNGAVGDRVLPSRHSIIPPFHDSMYEAEDQAQKIPLFPTSCTISETFKRRLIRIRPVKFLKSHFGSKMMAFSQIA